MKGAIRMTTCDWGRAWIPGLLCLLCTLTVAGCAAVGPNFVAPKPSVPETWRHTSGTGMDTGPAADAVDKNRTAEQDATRFDMQADPDPRWWRAFDDPILNQLIERAIAGNIDLKEAVLRISASRSQEQMARAAGLPSVNATASYTREQLGLKGLLQDEGATSGINSLSNNTTLNQLAPGVGQQLSRSGNNLLDSVNAPINLYQLGFDASWELDLFGRVRRQVESAKAQSDADIEQRNAALVSLEAEVARSYAQLRGAQAAQQVAQELIDTEKGLVELTQSQQEHGLANAIDVQAAKVQLATSQAQLPQYAEQITQAANGLAVLLGDPPGSLDSLLLTPRAIPPLPPSVPLGLPSSLARRRPDIRQAEATLHAATAETGVATAQMFPEVSLTGSFGYRTTEAQHIGRWANHFFSVGPGVSLPIFHGGEIVANIRMSRANQAAAALDYRKTVLNALSDVDNALAAYQSEHARRVALLRSVAAANESLDISRNGYQHGLSNFLNVLNAQATLAQNRASLVQSVLAETTDLVAVYKALGGGWQDATGGALPIGTLGNGGQIVGEPNQGATAK